MASNPNALFNTNMTVGQFLALPQHQQDALRGQAGWARHMPKKLPSWADPNWNAGEYAWMLSGIGPQYNRDDSRFADWDAAARRGFSGAGGDEWNASPPPWRYDEQGRAYIEMPIITSDDVQGRQRFDPFTGEAIGPADSMTYGSSGTLDTVERKPWKPGQGGLAKYSSDTLSAKEFASIAGMAAVPFGIGALTGAAGLAGGTYGGLAGFGEAGALAGSAPGTTAAVEAAFGNGAGAAGAAAGSLPWWQMPWSSLTQLADAGGGTMTDAGGALSSGDFIFPGEADLAAPSGWTTGTTPLPANWGSTVDVTGQLPLGSFPGQTASAAGLMATLGQMGIAPVAAKALIDKAASGEKGALDQLLKFGLPAALIAGLFENNKSPLTDNMRIAADRALASTAEFDALGAVPQTDSEKRAIALANANVGNYQPYLDRAGALADTAAGGVTDEMRARYMNPFMDDVLKNTIRDIEEAAGRRRESLKATTSMSGNDIGAYGGSPSRFNVEDSLLDRETLKSVGDTSAKLRMGAFDNAMNFSGKDLDRSMTASNVYGNLGKTVGALGATDVESLKTAGALERRPLDEERQRTAEAAKLYTGVIHGSGPALTATTPGSTLGKAGGALTTLKGLKDVGLYDTKP